VLEVVYFCALEFPLESNTVPATMAIITATMLPIQNDFIFGFSPKNRFGNVELNLF